MQRSTRQQDAIVAALRSAARPLGPGEILNAASADIPAINLTTVYRTIKRLLEAGQIAPVELPGEPPRYELRSAADHHHHHFRCDECDTVYDVPGCAKGISALVPRGFQLREHDLVLYGTCKACLTR